jgi:hypothetical protein
LNHRFVNRHAAAMGAVDEVDQNQRIVDHDAENDATASTCNNIRLHPTHGQPVKWDGRLEQANGRPDANQS